MKEQPATRLGKGDITEFVHDDAINAHELFFDLPRFAVSFLFDEQVDEINTVEEADFTSPPDQLCAKCCCDVSFAGSSSTDQDQVMFISDELPGAELVYQSLIDRCLIVIKRGEVPVMWKARRARSVLNSADFTFTALCLDKLAQRFWQAGLPLCSKQILGRVCHAV